MARIDDMKKFMVACFQQQARASRENNLSVLLDAIREAASQGAELIQLPELHNHYYFCQMQDPNYFDLAESIPGPTTQQFSQAAKQHGIVISASIFEKRAPGIYHNTAVVFEKTGEIAGIYRKMHIPDDPGFMEKFYFTPGDLGFTPIQTSIGKLGVLICWDQWFPEAARLMTLAGADLLLYPTAIGWDPQDPVEEKNRQRDAWITIQRAHAIANGLPLVTCNRTGFEIHPKDPTCGIQFWGSSFIAGPQGEFLQQASVENSELIFAEVDLAHSETVRRIWPFLRDRRIDFYQDLSLRFHRGE